MEKVYASFCPECYGNSRGGNSRSRGGNAPNYRLFAVLLVVFLVLLAGVGVLIVATR